MSHSPNHTTSVKVAVRIRPLVPDELKQQEDMSTNGIQPSNSHCIRGFGQRIIAEGDKQFTFDHVFSSESTQEEIYNECVVDLVNAAFDGFNATILAYGQTGSGKTWTMGSSSDMAVPSYHQGIIPRVVKHIFELVEEREKLNSNSSFKIQVQFLEIYGEDIIDLLDHTRTSKVVIREAPSGDVFMSGAKEETVNSTQQMLKALEDGSKHRTTGSTRMNQASSRSHAIFTVFIEHTIHLGYLKDGNQLNAPFKDLAKPENDAWIEEISLQSNAKGEVRKSKFHFVDLAGSERVAKTGAEGKQLKEGININQGLLALGNVISALGDETKRGKIHVPYRDSKITRILQDSLGGNSKTLMICCVSPAYSNLSESLNSLKYANRARNIKNTPMINRDPTVVAIEELKYLSVLLSKELLNVYSNVIHQPLNSSLSIDFLKNVIKSNEMKTGDNSFSVTQNMTSSILEQMKPNLNLNQFDSKQFEYKQILKSSDDEIFRISSKLRQSNAYHKELSDRMIILQTERDFYKMKWQEASPNDANTFLQLNSHDKKHSNLSIKQNKTINPNSTEYAMIQSYVREIESLKLELQLAKTRASQGTFEEELVDTDWSSNIADVIAQAKEFIKTESNLLHSSPLRADRPHEENPEISVDSIAESTIMDGNSSTTDNEHHSEHNEILHLEMLDLSKSIQVKETLVQQLEMSQQQYAIMKAFYEQKLETLQSEMTRKHEERNQLAQELHLLEQQQKDIDHSQVSPSAIAPSMKEKKLREELKKRDDELRMLKGKQEELNRLSQVQSRHMQQLAKLSSEIEMMKKQRVDLSKSLTIEKKKHLIDVRDKSKEIDILKRQLSKKIEEINRIGQDKQRVDYKILHREAMLLRQQLNQSQSKANGTLKRKGLPPLNMSGPVMSVRSNNRKAVDPDQSLKHWIDRQLMKLKEKEENRSSLLSQYEMLLSTLMMKTSLSKEEISCWMKEELPELINNIHHKKRAVEELVPLCESEVPTNVMSNSINSVNYLLELLNEATSTSIRLKSLYELSLEKEKSMKRDYDRMTREIQTLKITQDLELTKLYQEYEEKLQGLFDHSSIGQLVRREAGMQQQQQQQQQPLLESSSEKEENLMGLLLLSEERMRSLTQQLEREELRVQELEYASHSHESMKNELLDVIASKENDIQFLEEDRNFFKDMVVDLKVTLENVNKMNSNKSSNETISKSKQQTHSSMNSLKIDCDSDDILIQEEDDESEAILNEYEGINEEILRTKTINPNPNVKTTSGSRPTTASAASVIDRLTDPSYFTGVTKKVFQQDLSLKREKVQKMKSNAGPIVNNIQSITPTSTLSTTTSSTTNSNIQMKANESKVFRKKEMHNLIGVSPRIMTTIEDQQVVNSPDEKNLIETTLKDKENMHFDYQTSSTNNKDLSSDCNSPSKLTIPTSIAMVMDKSSLESPDVDVSLHLEHVSLEEDIIQS